MTLSDACGVIALLGMGMLAAALILSVIRRTLLRRGKIQRVAALKRIMNILLGAGVSFWCLASILVFVQASQSNH